MSAFWAMAMALLVAVKGPIVQGVEGTIRVTPDGGTGLGIGTSKVNGPLGDRRRGGPRGVGRGRGRPLSRAVPEWPRRPTAIDAGKGTWAW